MLYSFVTRCAFCLLLFLSFSLSVTLCNILLAVFISLQSFILNVFLGSEFVPFLVQGKDDEMVEVEISHSKRPDIACQLGVDPVVFS